MQTPIKITQRPSPNRTIGRQGHIPDFIVLHTSGASFTSAVNTILNPTSQASYHFVISSSGEIVQAVSIENMAWANGTTNSGDNRDNRHSTIPAVRERRVNANLYSISIAFGDMPAGNPSEAQLNAAVQLIRHIRSEVQRIYKFTIPLARTNIVGHDQITPITRPDCPGKRFPWDELMRRLNNDNINNNDSGSTSINVSNIGNTANNTANTANNTAAVNGDGLTMSQYNELLSKINQLEADNKQLRENLDRWTTNSRIRYAWVDSNMPSWARGTITKLTSRGWLQGVDAAGRLQLSDDMLRLFVILDRANAFE